MARKSTDRYNTNADIDDELPRVHEDELDQDDTEQNYGNDTSSSNKSKKRSNGRKSAKTPTQLNSEYDEDEDEDKYGRTIEEEGSIYVEDEPTQSQVFLNKLSKKFGYSGEHKHWSEVTDMYIRPGGSIFPLFRPTREMLSDEVEAIGYATPDRRSTDKSGQISITFDRDYIVAWLHWGLEKCQLNQNEAKELFSDYQDWEYKSKMMEFDRLARELARIRHEAEGENSEGIEAYYRLYRYK